MSNGNIYMIMFGWFIFYSITYVIWAIALHVRYDGNRNTIGTYLLGGVLWYLCCIGGWAFMAWMFFAPEQQIPASLKKC